MKLSIRKNFLFVVLTAGLLLSVWPQGLIQRIDSAIACLVVALLFVVFLIGEVFAQQTWMPDLKLHPLVVLGFLSIVVLNSFVSVDSYQTEIDNLRLCGVAMTGVIFYHLADVRRANVFAAFLIAVGLFYGFYGIAQSKGYFPSDFCALPGTLSSRLVNSVHFAGFLLISLMACVGLFFSPAHWWWKLIAVISFPILLKFLPLTASRSGWICFVFSLLVYLYVLGQRKWRELSWGYRTAVLALIISGLVLGVYLVHDVIWGRVAILFETRFQTMTQRMQVWGTCIVVLLNYPLGIGMGNLFRVSPEYKIMSDRFLVDFAHNEMLQIAVEWGFLGLVIAMILIGMYFQKMRDCFRYNRQGLSMSLQAGLFATVMGLFMQSLIDFPLRIPSNAYFLAAIIGFQLGLTHLENKTVTRKNQGWQYMSVFLICLLGSLMILTQASRVVFAEKWLLKAGVMGQRFAWAEAKAAFRRSMRFAPSNADGENEMGRLLLKRSIVAKDKHIVLEESAKALEKSLIKSPWNDGVHVSLALIYDRLGRLEEATDHYRMAVMLNPQNGEPYFRSAVFLLEHGQIVQAPVFFRVGLQKFCEYYIGGFEGVLEKMYAVTKHYRLLLACVPEDFELQFRFAQFLYAKGDKEGFDSVSQTALNLKENRLERATRFLKFVSEQDDRMRMERLGKLVVSIKNGVGAP